MGDMGQRGSTVSFVGAFGFVVSPVIAWSAAQPVVMCHAEPAAEMAMPTPRPHVARRW